jgi:hypothetical protein
VGLEIVCVERKGQKAQHRHVRVVGIEVNGTVIRFSVKTVRKIIKQGSVEFFCADPSGERRRVRRYKCRCGVKTIRTGDDDVADGALSSLSHCGSEPKRVSPA